jgi:outer membrane receptor protein involved in Fe transport
MPRFIFWVSALLLALPLVLVAQTETGNLSGQVRDESGGAVPGTSITATSQERGFSRTTTSDPNGRFHFAAIPIGRYQVVAALSGFQTVTASNNLVETAKTTDLNITMRLAGETAEVEVSGEVPIVDKTNTSLETRMRSKEFEKMPVGRSFQNMFLSAPGVNLPPGTNPNPNVHGALSGNNQWLFDGVDITDPTTGTFGGNLNFEAIQEITVYTSGVSAEYGRATGGIINIITKSGTNQLSGSFKYIATNDDWNDQNKTKNQVTGASLERVKFDHVNPVYTGTLGGPFWKDHIWFFGAYESSDVTGVRQTTVVSGEEFQQVTESRFWAGKLTFQVTPSHMLQGRANHSPTDGFIAAYGAPADLAAYTGQDQTSEIYGGQWTGVFGSNLSAEAGYNWNGPGLDDDKSFIDVYPRMQSPITNGAPHFSLANSRYYNGSFFDGYVKRPRQGANAAATYFADIGGNNHSFKAGIDWQRLKSASLFTFQNNQLFIDESFDFQTGTFVPFQRRDYDPPVPSLSTGTIWAGYIRDKFEVGRRLFFEVGFRYEHQEGEDDISRSTVDSDTISPRFSASYDLFGTGKTLIVGTYGRFYQFITQGFSDAFVQNVQKGSYSNYEWDGTQYVLTGHISLAGSSVQPNPGLDPTFVDEGTLGFRQQVGNSIGVSLTGVYRKWGDLIDDIIAIDSSGQTTTTYVNYGPAERKYYGVELVFDKRFSRNWNANFNYTWSRTEGNHYGNTATELGDYLNAQCRTTVDPSIGNNGVIPCAEVADGSNKDGRAGYDQEHNLKFGGAYTRSFGPVNLTAGLGGQLVTGLPYEKVRSLNVLRPGSTANAGPLLTYFYEARGSDELPTLFQLDGSLEATLTVFGRVELGVKGEVFNITDEQEARAVNLTTWCNNTVSPSASCTTARDQYGTTTARGSFLPPRNYRLTALLRF